MNEIRLNNNEIIPESVIEEICKKLSLYLFNINLVDNGSLTANVKYEHGKEKQSTFEARLFLIEIGFRYIEITDKNNGDIETGSIFITANYTVKK